MEAKGRAFRSAIDFLEIKFKQEKIKSFYSEHPEFLEIMKYTDLNWYSMDLFLKFTETIDKYFGFGDSSLLLEMGEYSAKTAFDNSLKLFKDLSMELFLSNAQAVFLSYYSAGAVEIKYIHDNKIKIMFKSFPCSPCFEKNLYGWLKQSVKFVKVRSAAVEIMNLKDCMCFSLEWIK